MFDVSWSDPERETVAQRRSRKEQQAAATSAQSSSSSVRSSESSKSNESTHQSTTRVSLLTFLNGNRKDKKNTKDSILRSTSSSRLATARPISIKDESHASRRYSSYTEQIGPVEEDPTTPRAVDDNAFFMTTPDHKSRHSRQTDTSIFSARTENSMATNTSWGSTVETSRKPSLVQPLSPKSFVTQTTEVTVSSSTGSVHEVEQVATVVHISSNGNHQIEVSNGQPKQSDSPDPFNGGVMHGSSETLSAAAERELLEPGKWPNWQPPETWKHVDDESILPTSSSLSPSSPPPPLSPLPTLPCSSLSSSTKRSRRKVKKDRQIPSELSHLQKSIRMKEAATQKIMLERLKEEWMVNVDASVYRELELEKQLWMLTALRAQNKDDDTDSIPSPGLSVDTSSASLMSRPVKILSLFENHASASFLSALNPTCELHHLSTTPLSPTSYPNVYPLLLHIPGQYLPYANNSFEAIHSFSLASGVLPSSSIPPMLSEIHRCLAPGTGRLHLIVLDPSPCAGTLGPRLRTWLETHLITNLERQFRCLNPSRLFPLWLADAGLRAEGSTIRNNKFRAVVPDDQHNSGWSFGFSSGGVGVGGENHGDLRLSSELASVVGRMLWKECWGGWVEGREWWWEDPEVVEECARMGTVWEYFVIEAVRDN